MAWVLALAALAGSVVVCQAEHPNHRPQPLPFCADILGALPHEQQQQVRDIHQEWIMFRRIETDMQGACHAHTEGAAREGCTVHPCHGSLANAQVRFVHFCSAACKRQKPTQGVGASACLENEHECEPLPDSHGTADPDAEWSQSLKDTTPAPYTRACTFVALD